jgi:hypothetical protein
VNTSGSNSSKNGYNDSKVIYSGPKYESMQLKKTKLFCLSVFGSAMQFKGKGTHTNLLLADDKKFVWAEPK